MLPPRLAVASPAPAPCAHHRDGFACVDQPGCGWCAHRYTCVPGDESGPLPSGLPCPGNSSDAALHNASVLPMRYRAPFHPGCDTDFDKCPSYTGPLYTYTEDALRATGYRGANLTTSAPELWDILCEAGGMRSSVVAHYFKGYTPYWLSQACDCPAGRNGCVQPRKAGRQSRSAGQGAQRAAPGPAARRATHGAPFQTRSNPSGAG